MALAGSFGVSVMVNGSLIDPHENTGRKKADFDLSFDEDMSIKEKKREMLPPLYDPADHEFFMKRRNRPMLSDKGLYCSAGRSGFAVNWDGIMLPCLSFPRDVVCAHPLCDGFHQAWSEVNEGVKNYEVPKECHSCELNDKCHYCPMNQGVTVCRPSATVIYALMVGCPRGRFWARRCSSSVDGSPSIVNRPDGRRCSACGTRCCPCALCCCYHSE